MALFYVVCYYFQMTLHERLEQSEQKFNTKQSEREQLLTQAEECFTEMTKIQGEWRLLNDLINEGEPKKARK